MSEESKEQKTRLVPNWEGECMTCVQSPIVDVEVNGVLEVTTGLCGPCFLGTAKAIDPGTWNEE